MLDKLKEFKETFSERVRSPFIGSLIITWSLIHWKIYALFFFEQTDISISDRISGIEEYLKTQDSCDLIVSPIFITLGVLLLYNFLNALGLIVKLLYDNWASPYIQEKLYNKNIIEKPKYEKLKREYNTIKSDYDDDKEKFIASEEERRNIKTAFDNYKNSGFEGTLLNDITGAMQSNIQWVNFFTLPDGKSGSEIFTCDNNGFNLLDGKKFKIENIKITPNGKILSFNKVIDGVSHPNFLIRDSAVNYYGVEDEKTLVVYKKMKDKRIAITQALYKCDNNFIDVTSTVQKLVDNGIIEFKVTNELMGGDPGYEKQKLFIANYNIDGKPTSLSAHEGSTVKIE